MLGDKNLIAVSLITIYSFICMMRAKHALVDESMGEGLAGWVLSVMVINREGSTFANKLGRGKGKIDVNSSWQHPLGLLRRWKMLPNQQNHTFAKADKSSGKCLSVISLLLPFNISLTSSFS